MFEEFHEIPPKQWKQKIQYDLQGKDYNETLITDTPEGIRIKPFYSAEDRPELAPAQPDQSWKICERVYVSNLHTANRKAMHALNSGSESILFHFDKRFEDLQLLFEGVSEKAASIYLEVNLMSADFVEELCKALQNVTGQIYLLNDPIGHLATTGNWFSNREKDLERWMNIQHHLSHTTSVASGIHINTTLYQESGANSVQLLAYTLCHLVEYLNALEDKNKLSLLSGSKTVFTVAAGSDYFMEIAKLRALRLLYRLIAEEYGLPGECHLYGSPSLRNKTIYDYNVNMLRTTGESMSLILGGASAVCSMPYDFIFHKDNEFGSRIARNQLLILKEEAHFDEAAKAADGAYYIEALTEELATKALELFKQLESGGGLLQELRDHTLQRKIRENANEELKAFKEQQLRLIGTNCYLNTAESMKNSLELHPFLKKNPQKTLVEPILPRRIAEKSENDRLKNEQHG
ncbi:methylmalonyl-CoA mutase subunit beta [Robertkochia solimangrovi]|uniref:methylmalonyl-CoA mutase subunit beta n=1 Tax=Robertkochia solimangrovi TaxID=2213046 RepID=UPI001180D480|nr:methylmalonyl-CoA mutase subunit beta [Robertkochia solimangrovi]TRZ42843.1 methylmalonyl-CoA mutase [Robertkochia solimangrovi]